MTDPGRYDRPDPCDDCGKAHRGDCDPEPWPDSVFSFDEAEWLANDEEPRP